MKLKVLSQEEWSFFQENGYLRLRAVFAPEEVREHKP